MTSVGVMASGVNLAGGCTDVLAENFTNLTKWVQAGSPAPSIVAGRNGSGVSFPTFSTATLTYTIPAVNEADTVTVGFAFKPASWGGGETNILWLLSDAGATQHDKVTIRNDGSMAFYRGVSGLASTAAATFTTGVYSYLEVQAKLHDTTGFFTVKLNGTTVMSATNVDTKNAGTKTTFDAIQLLCASTGAQVVFDDLYLSTGACTFKGDHAIP